MIESVWQFLTDPNNRDVLGWLGGGAVVVIGGLWAAFRKRPPAKQDTPSVRVTKGVVARDITGSPINIDTSGTTTEPERGRTESAPPKRGRDANQD